MRFPKFSPAVLLFLGLFLTIAMNLMQAQANTDEQLAYIGTYTEGKNKGKGIYCYRFLPSKGEMRLLNVTQGIKNPSFLALHPNGKFLYAVSEIGQTNGKPGGSVWAYKIDNASGALTLINHQSSEGDGPCYAAVDNSGSCLLVANYDNGSIASLPIKSDGSLGKASSAIQHEGSSVDPERQKGPHAHSINVSPDNHYVVAADLGMDKLLIYKLDTKTSTLVKNEPAFCSTPPGGGPRHLSFAQDGRFAYVANEMKSSISVCSFDAAKGALHEIQTVSTLKSNRPGNSTAEIKMHPGGRFLYCSNRGDDSLAIFSVDHASGKLTLLGHQKTGGSTPRNFGIDPSGNYIVVCNQNSDNVLVFKIDLKTGLLNQLGETVTVPSPVCVKFLIPSTAH